MAGILPASIEDASPQSPGGVTDEKPNLRIVTDGDETTIDIDGDDDDVADPSFDDNLAKMPGMEQALSSIASDLIEGIDSDEQSRQGWVENYVNGLDLLGLKIETQSVARGRRSTSKVRHPQLLWAIVQFQAQARGEMLPANGPCKVTKKLGLDTQQSDDSANQVERDLNYYLTVAAPEYYPDTDRMLFYLGYGGTTFKKIYRCPVRKRPVSESVYLPDLIVSNDATDMENAERVTHRIEMMDRQIRQMQIDGIYLDVELTTAAPVSDKIREKEREIQGRKQSSSRPKDMPHTIYECYCFLDLSEYGHGEDGQPDRLPLPYRVTLDRDSRQILEIRRNWKQGDDKFRRRRVFVKFGLVPGMGFLDLGYLHLLGNQTKALTALWRVLIDAGIFSAAPAGVRLKGARADTNEINPGPGEFAPIDVSVDDIKKALMPLPYKEPSAVLLQMIGMLEASGQKLVGATMGETGEGRTNIPVGTIMAMIEQQTQIMASVHKRLHSAQQEELILLKDLFAENPDDLRIFTRGNSAAFLATEADFENFELTPASDPNVPAQIHRTMQATALAQLATNPVAAPYFNQIAVLKRILSNAGIGDPEAILNLNPQPPGQQGPDPKDLIAAQKLQLQKEQMEQKTQGEQQQQEFRIKEIALESADRAADRQSRESVANIKAATEKDKLRTTEAMHGTEQLVGHQQHLDQLGADQTQHNDQMNLGHRQASIDETAAAQGPTE